MIEVTPSLFIDENDLSFDFIRSSGPGGQNVNKVASAVQLRFNVDASKLLPEEVKLRLHTIAGQRINEAGVLVIEARRFRSQEDNRQDALERLVLLIRKAMQKPRPRKATLPSPHARYTRQVEKKKRAQVKRTRRLDPQELE